MLIRSCYRVAELSSEFHSTLANNEIDFMVLEGVIIILAISMLTVFHPGCSFGGSWSTTGWKIRNHKTYQDGSVELVD
jgi:RTA1 like protein